MYFLLLLHRMVFSGECGRRILMKVVFRFADEMYLDENASKARITSLAPTKPDCINGSEDSEQLA